MEMLGAITGLIGAGLQAQAQQNQLEYEYSALNWQKERANQQDWMASAAKSDQYGNVTSYDPVLNKWSVNLSPTQKTLSDDQQKEQLLQLTQDAPAARKVRQAVQQRSQEAQEPYLRASLGYQFDQPPSEESIRSKLTGLMANNDQQTAKLNQSLLMRQAARLGQGAHASDIIQATDANLGNPTNVQNRMLQARQDALKEFGARESLHEEQWGKPMAAWANLMSQGGDIPAIPRSAITDTTGSQQQAMLQAFNQGSTGVGSAMQNVASAMGKSPDLSSVAKIIASIGQKSGKSTTSSDTSDPSLNLGGVTIAPQSTYDTSDLGRNDWGVANSSESLFG